MKYLSILCALAGLVGATAPVPPRQDLVRIALIRRMGTPPVFGAKTGSVPDMARDLDRLGVTINDMGRDYCIAEAGPELLERLRAQGWQITVLKENISRTYYDNALTASTDGRYLTYAEFIDTMNTMAVNNPTICHLETLAHSAGGRLVLAMKVSDNPQVNEPEPVVLWDANTHGDEKIGWAVAYEFLKYLLRNYGSNPVVTELVNTREIWICPMFNPDGNYSSSRYNDHNVDLNRDWGWMWGEEAAPGSAAMGESEVTGLVEMLWRNPVTIWVSYHAGTECIPYPWSYTDYDTIPEKPLIDWLSAGYSARGNGYEYGQGSIVMYLINGSSKDLGYGTMGAMAWSIEVNYSKTPPASEIDTTFLRNRDAMLFFCRQAGHGIQGTVSDSLTEQPLRAQILVGPRNWPSFSERTNGDFHRFCFPGAYSLTVRCPGYDDKTISNVVVPNSGDSSVNVAVQLAPNPSAPLFGFQVLACSAVTISGNRTYPVAALGVHDNVPYQLDANHWIVIDLDQPIQDGPGNDFAVFRFSGTGTAAVQVANIWNGPWVSAGTANGARTDFDLGVTGLESARYVRLKASGSFMFDAIEANQMTGLAEHPPADEILRVAQNDRGLTVYPNPVTDQAWVACSPTPEQDLQLVLYDALGRRLTTLEIPAHKRVTSYKLQVTSLENGVYFLRMGTPPVFGAKTGSVPWRTGTRFVVCR
jgi:hypothetical protein